MFPKNKAGFAIDNQYYIGSSGLLVKPITAPDVTETDIYLAEDQVTYESLHK
jgi:mannosyl-oligosaccharide alpha-1,3-glucosidase